MRITSKSRRQNSEIELLTLLLEDLEERGRLERCETLARKVVNRFLGFLHSCDVVGKRGHFVGGFCGIEAEEFSENVAILAVFMDAKLKVLGESFVKGLELIFVFGNLLEKFKTLLDEMLPDDLFEVSIVHSYAGIPSRSCFVATSLGRD